MPRVSKRIEEGKKQIKELRKRAQEMDVEQRLIFETTLDRYETLIEQVDKLRIEMEKSPTTISKEYVKGRENIVVNPIIGAYNQTVATANKTAETLTRIVKGFAEIAGEKPDDPLMEILSGTVS